jgi:hypothetical protein
MKNLNLKSALYIAMLCGGILTVTSCKDNNSSESDTATTESTQMDEVSGQNEGYDPTMETNSPAAPDSTGRNNMGNSDTESGTGGQQTVPGGTSTGSGSGNSSGSSTGNGTSTGSGNGSSSTRSGQ